MIATTVNVYAVTKIFVENIFFCDSGQEISKIQIFWNFIVDKLAKTGKKI